MRVVYREQSNPDWPNVVTVCKFCTDFIKGSDPCYILLTPNTLYSVDASPEALESLKELSHPMHVACAREFQAVELPDV